MAKKKRPVAILTSDNHLQDRAWHSRKTLEHDAYWAFDFMVEYAAENEIPAIVAAGDLIDKQKNESEIANFVREQMEFCQENDIKFYFTQGQHEMQPTPWFNAVHKWPIHLAEDREQYIGPFKVWGIDWTPIEELQERLDEVPDDTDLLVMHQVCSEWMGSITTPELHWNMISHATHLLVGDYHGIHESMTKRNRTNMMTIYCPGSQAMQAIDEPKKKGFFVLYDDGSSRSVIVPSRHILQPPDLLSESELETFLEHAESACTGAQESAAIDGLWPELHKPILYVRYQYDIPDAYSRIDRAIGEHAHVFHKTLEPKPTEEQIEERQERKKVIEGGLVGALPQLVNREEKPDVFHVAKRLLESRVPQDELFHLREEYLETEQVDS